nr:hypothetical protein Iba_chr06aCG11520 [Ipomoea batatas]
MDSYYIQAIRVWALALPTSYSSFLNQKIGAASAAPRNRSSITGPGQMSTGRETEKRRSSFTGKPCPPLPPLPDATPANAAYRLHLVVILTAIFVDRSHSSNPEPSSPPPFSSS